MQRGKPYSRLCWELANGDPLLALWYALELLPARPYMRLAGVVSR